MKNPAAVALGKLSPGKRNERMNKTMTKNEERYGKQIGTGWNVDGYRFSLYTETEPENEFDGLAYWLCRVEISSGLRRDEAILDLKYGRNQKLPSWMQEGTPEYDAAPDKVRWILETFK